MRDFPPIRQIKREKLEIWQEANVRKIDIKNNIEEFANNIKRNGIENPLLVKQGTDGMYKIFTGQRRFLASELIKLDTLPCRVYQNISLKDAIALSLGENIFSHKMTVLDKANAVNTLLKVHKDKDKVCKILGIKRATLQVYRSYNGLSNEIKNFVDDGLINMQFAVKVNHKFSRNNAIEILRHVSKTKKLSVNRKILISAINSASNDDSLEDIKHIIRNLGDSSLSIPILMGVPDAKALQKIANDKKITVDELTLEIIQRYIKNNS